MSDEGSQLRETLAKRLDSLQVPTHIPSPTIRRAKRRRIAASVATGAVAMVVLAGAVYGATTLTDSRRPDLAPAETGPICSPEQIDDVTTEVSDPDGTGGGHFGVLFEVQITGHDPGCQPTIYVELDDAPALPPDDEGPDADEFRDATLYSHENPCLAAVHVEGDFLYSGKHTIEVGVGCDPDQDWPHDTQRVIRFDGDTHERIDDDGFQCPDLVRPGPQAREAIRPVVEAYLDARQPEGTDGYNYRIKRLHGRSELGFPFGKCPVKTWRRSFRVEGSFEYEEGATNQSASLAYFRIIVGRTNEGWIVWAEPH